MKHPNIWQKMASAENMASPIKVIVCIRFS